MEKRAVVTDKDSKPVVEATGDSLRGILEEDDARLRKAAGVLAESPTPTTGP